MIKCNRCNGRKYIELDKVGLVVKTCPECHGTGEVDEAYIAADACSIGIASFEDAIADADKPIGLIIPEAIPGKTVDETVDIARKIIEAQVIHDDRDRTERDNSDSGEPNPSKPISAKKPKIKRKARKRSR